MSDQAPRRKLVSVDKVGEWGNFEYVHSLECGHVIVRKRESFAKKLTCEACVLAVAKDAELRALAVAPVRPKPTDLDDLLTIDDDQLAEVEAGRVRAGLASELKVPLEVVDVIVADIDGRLVVSSAVVFLSATDAKRIAKIT